MYLLRKIYLFLLFSLVVIIAQESHAQARSTVFVLSTLHQFHSDSSFYSFTTLSNIVRDLKPDVICVELTPTDLASRKEQKTKQEYPKSIFPLADKYGYRMVPMEPGEPLFTELVGLTRQSERELRENHPDKAEAFSIFTEELYKQLFAQWDSVLAINSQITDSNFEVKHRYQNALFGAKQEGAWEEWNKHFLQTIVDTAQKYKGKRIVVLVGVEHAYWLRARLRTEKSIRLKVSSDFLKKM